MVSYRFGSSPLARQRDGQDRTVIALGLVMGAHDDAVDTGRNAQAVEIAGERLFVRVRMQQHAGPEHRSVERQDLEAVGIVLPAGVVAAHGDIEVVDAGRLLTHFDTHHIRRAGP